ncbi:cytochrome b reductase 1 [Galendromus occidentalis]|uniref:Cytochrome b reductase 1 n=1 Tax=Galendromus occidentalis TaxID=34638 RepID=A0AAJ6QVL9_9ACAR|nr:cytochrome b reductase 1 [Galendromus occidentalis]
MTVRLVECHALRKSSTRANEEVDGRMMMLDKPMGSAARAFLNFLTFIAELLLVGILSLTLFWVFHHEGGVAWRNDVKRQFNLHFILMLGGFIFLNGQAILSYRLFGCVRRIYAKLIHAFLLVAAAGSIAVGFYMAFEANDRVPKTMHFYSLHSWLALGTCALFVLQFFVGFFSFLVLLCCDGATSSFRACLIPVHATFGLAIFSMASATAVTGLMQAARARLNGQNANPDYREFPQQGIIINTIAAAIILLVILMPLVTRNNIRGGRAVFASE